MSFLIRFARYACTIACLLVLFGGCGGESSSRSSDAERPAPVVAEVDLEIGVMEGEASFMFGRIGGVTADEQGRIFVADTQGDVVRAYDAEGTHLFDVATSGEGPGEVDNPCCPTIGPEGALWIRDDQNRRYARYQVDAEGATHDGQIRMDHSAFGRTAPVTFDSNGHLIDIGGVAGAEGFQTVRMHRSANDETTHQQAIPEAPEDRIDVQEVDIEGGKAFIPQPFGARGFDAHAPNSDWAFAVTDRYQVVRYNADGDTLHVIERDVEGPALSEEEREQAQSSLDAYTDNYGISTGALDFGVPDRKPPITRIFFDAQSRLWVERTVADGVPHEADVYDQTGTLVEVVQWPAGVRLDNGLVTDSLMYGIRQQDVPQVVRLRR